MHFPCDIPPFARIFIVTVKNYMQVIEINETKQLQTFSVSERLRIVSGVEKAGNCAVASNCHVSVNGIQDWRNRKIFFYKVVVTNRLFMIKKQNLWGQKVSLCHF
jgi:hypothetical protein